MKPFYLFSKVLIVSGKYAGKQAVVGRIILDGPDKGVWLYIEGEYGIHRVETEEIEAISHYGEEVSSEKGA